VSLALTFHLQESSQKQVTRIIVLLLLVLILATGLVLGGVSHAEAATKTIFLNKWQVALWATAGTSAVVAALVSSFGISAAAAWGMVGTVIGVFWGAVWWGKCAWVSVGPFSAGSYSC
jgi:hypothetical protein